MISIKGNYGLTQICTDFLQQIPHSLERKRVVPKMPYFYFFHDLSIAAYPIIILGEHRSPTTCHISQNIQRMTRY